MKLQELKKLQQLPLKNKIEKTRNYIISWYLQNQGKIYISFSGGKNSTVLLNLTRRIISEIPAVFVNTGQEFPQVLEFVENIENVIWLKPRMSFPEITEKYGFPVISKKISMGVSRYRNTKSEIQKKLRLYGGINPSSGKKQHPTISKKWHFLVDAPFKISERCCEILKLQPLKKYEKETGKKPILGMAEESNYRKLSIIRNGISDKKCQPLTFWSEKDIWDYIEKYKIPYSKIYDLGEKKTGCVGCLCGKEIRGRFLRLKKTSLEQYKLLSLLGYEKILDFLERKKGKNYSCKN